MKEYFINSVMKHGFSIENSHDGNEEYNGELVEEYGNDYLFFKRKNATCKLWEKSGVCVFTSPLLDIKSSVGKSLDLKLLSDSFVNDNMRALKYFENESHWV